MEFLAEGKNNCAELCTFGLLDTWNIFEVVYLLNTWEKKKKP